MIKARNFKIDLTIKAKEKAEEFLSNKTDASCGEKDFVSYFVKSISMEVEGDAMMSADKARQIVR